VETFLLVLISLVASLLAAIMSAEEAAGALLSPSRLMRLAETELAGAQALSELFSNPQRLRAATALTSGAAYAAVGVTSSVFLIDSVKLVPLPGVLLGGFLSIVIVFSLVQTLPRTIAVQNPEDVALGLAPIVTRIVAVLRLPLSLLEWPWRRLVGLVIKDRVVRLAWQSEPDARTINSDDPQSEFEVAEEALLVAVSDFTEKVVREIMVPRTDMTCLPDSATAQDAVDIIQRHGYSRLPLYHETLDDIRGVVYAKDLLPAILKDPTVAPATLARNAYFVPETKPVQQLLLEMRDRTHIAIVADEYGGTAGLVTIEDLLEEIVGEIQDEYDWEKPLVDELADGSYRVDARLPVDDLNEMFGTAVESESDTVGGVVIEVAGRIPEVGDEVVIEGLKFRVTEVQGTRIRQLVVESVKHNNVKESENA